MAFNRFPFPGPGPGMPGVRPGVAFHMNSPYCPMPPTFPIMGGPPVNPGWQRGPMIPVRPNLGNPNMPMQQQQQQQQPPPKDMGYWRGSDRLSPVRDFNMDNRGQQERKPDRDRDFGRRDSPLRQVESFDFLHAERETSSEVRRVMIVPKEKRYSPDRRDRGSSRDRDRGDSRDRDRRDRGDSRDRDRRDRGDSRDRDRRDRGDSRDRDRRDRGDSRDRDRDRRDYGDTRDRTRRDSRDRDDDGPSGSKKIRYSDSISLGRYGRENDTGDRYDDRNQRDRDRDRTDDFGRSGDRGREDDHRYDSLLRRDSPAVYQDRGGSRRSESPRRDERNGYRRSPVRRSPLRRSPGRRSPGRRSMSWSSPGRSPSRRSPGRRSPRRRSPDWRSSDRSSPSRRSPGRRSLGRRSPDRGSPGHGYWRTARSRSPDSRHRDRNAYRHSPDSRDSSDSYRRSPADRYRRDDHDRSRHSPSRRASIERDYNRVPQSSEMREEPNPSGETWKCPKCEVSNYGTRRVCFKCKFVHGKGLGPFQSYVYPPKAKQPSNTPEECMKRIHVSNLDHTTTAEDLAHYFSRWGRVVYANLVINIATKRSKGYGFVSFSTASEASDALANYHTIRGRAVTVNPLKYSEKIECRLEDLYDEISSDEEDSSGPMDSLPRFICKVKYCGFQGVLSEFRHHWKEIHMTHGKYLICPVCDTGCPDRPAMRRHLMFAHGVTDDGGAMDKILKNIKIEERRNPYYLDPGSVEKEGKREILHDEEPINPFKVFKCPEKGCPFAATANPLLQHWHTKHLNSSDSLSCPVCSVKFIRKGLLIEHFRIGHGIGTATGSESLSIAGAERISSDEDEAEYSVPSSRYMCKVTGCKFQGPKSAFKRHWSERHEFMEKYLACPYCGIGCRDHSEIRYHMISVHRVQSDDPILDDALIRSFIKERINPDYLDPGDVEPEDKFEVPVTRSKQSSSSARKGPSLSSSGPDPPKRASSKTSDVNQKVVPKPEQKSVSTQTAAAKDPTPSTSSNNPPAFEMMKYNHNNTESIKKFLAWTDSLMEKLEEAHHEARKKLNTLEEARQEKLAKKESKAKRVEDDKEEEKDKGKEKSASKKADNRKTAAKKTEPKKPPAKKTDTKSKESSKKKPPEPSQIRPIETRGRYTRSYKGRNRR